MLPNALRRANRLTRRLKNPTHLGIQTLEDRSTPTVSSIVGNLNGTAIPAGDTIWFSSVAKIGGLGANQVTLHVENASIQFTVGTTHFNVPVPNGEIVFTPGATSTTSTYDPNDNDWDVAVPSSGTGNVFLSGVEFPVAANLPGGIKNVTWSANFWTDTAGVNVNWQWGAAVYRSFSTDYNAVGVKPVDSNHFAPYTNGNKAGTPENFKASVTGGGTGGGGTNYTGNLTPGKGVNPQVGDGTQDYPYPSSNPLTSIAFNESTVLKAANLDTTNGYFELWYSDEHALALGVGTVIVNTASGTTTTNYPIAPLTSDPGVVNDPAVGSTIASGDQAGTDVSGRPMFPSLFITDITNNPNNRSGDWQWGGTAYQPSTVFGAWKSFTRTVDYTTGNPAVSVGTGVDPARNGWNLGAGSDAPPGNVTNEGYGAEVRWSLSDLQAAGVLVPGHNYRFYVIVHDGDQNKAGGDAGQASFQYSYPGVAGSMATLSGKVTLNDSLATPLQGVTINLIDATGAVVMSTTTAADGTYSFTGIAPGTYTVQQYLDPAVFDPTIYYAVSDSVGTVGGTQDGSIVDVNDIGSVVLSAGSVGINYNFVDGMTNTNPG
jgi:hypothetical protein